MLTAALALLMGFGTPLDVSKCPNRLVMPGYAPDQPVVLVDGIVLDGGLAAMEKMPRPHHLDITCWNPRDNVYHTTTGVTVIRVVTEEAGRGSRDPLHSLIAAQVAFQGEHGRYATRLEDLLDYGFALAANVEFIGSASEWTAATRVGESPYRCVATQESMVDRDANGEPELACEPDDAVGLDELRNLYQQGR